MNDYINSKPIQNYELPEIKINNEKIDWKWANIDEIKELEVSDWLKKLLSEKEYYI